jgi:penicillin-binding protein 1C
MSYQCNTRSVSIVLRPISQGMFRGSAKPVIFSVFLLLAAWLFMRYAPMAPLFEVPRGTLLLDSNGELLGATVAADGQWRLEASGKVPAGFQECLLEFEDRHFFSHHGVHLPSLVRAWKQNRQAGRTVSGGSTLTMQLARMSGAGGPRSHGRKIAEIWKALRLEMRHDKQELLSLYAAHAPFGANVVGLEAAAWRWFGRAPQDMSWAENALLAVLPNAPSLMHPGRHRDALKAKRDRLLGRLHKKGLLDDMEYSLAVEEPLPEAPMDLPRRAPHLLATLAARGGAGNTMRTTVDGRLQDRVTAIAERYAPLLQANQVHNAALLVLEVESGRVLAYVGNLASAGRDHAGDVDVVQARRSTGSLLKPFLHASMLQAGELMPDQLVADLPTHMEGLSPKNFDRRHEGAVPASQALARSLNVPATRALREHGVDRTLNMLRGMGLLHVDRSASD